MQLLVGRTEIYVFDEQLTWCVFTSHILVAFLALNLYFSAASWLEEAVLSQQQPLSATF